MLASCLNKLSAFKRTKQSIEFIFGFAVCGFYSAGKKMDEMDFFFFTV